MSDADSPQPRPQLDERLQRRDASPLAPGELLRVQAISRGKNPGGNQRFTVMKSGDVFEAGHSGDTSDWQTPFDVPLPAKPSHRVRAASLKKLELLLATRFAEEQAYQSDPTVEGGLFMVLTGFTGEGQHEVIYDAVRPPLLREILEVARDWK